MDMKIFPEKKEFRTGQYHHNDLGGKSGASWVVIDNYEF